MIRLYRAPFSTNVERVALALAHKGLEVESVWVDYADRSPVERISGQPLVPVVEFDDGQVVADSMQIVRVLEERFPFAPLYPPMRSGAVGAMRFIDWFNDVWKVAPNAIADEISAETPDLARIDGLAASMSTALDRFEGMLEGRDYLFGSAFSAVDCAALSVPEVRGAPRSRGRRALPSRAARLSATRRRAPSSRGVDRPHRRAAACVGRSLA